MSDLLVVFGGFRGGISSNDAPVISFQEILGGDFATYIDKYQDAEDSLSKRLKTVIKCWGNEFSSISTLHVLAFSMGCHLAGRFIDHVISSNNLVSIGHVLLVGVDPKFRPGAQDIHERTLGIDSAFDEASRLWEDIGAPGKAFTETLKKISVASESMRVVLCASDGITERNKNVDQLIAAFMNSDEIRMVEAIDGQHITAFNISVNLSEKNPETHDLDVHFRLWQAVSVCSGF